MFKKIFNFFKSVKTEMSYVSWPNKDDIKEGTTVVIVMAIFVAIFLSLIDTGFGFLIRKLLVLG
ncbi:MAG: preprotein translocase subunit SecE [Candidatus Cloacimonetes bacterium]|nr:preprotein translocase subunit SecE [Candidatus Cloacimonadota bacterium]